MGTWHSLAEHADQLGESPFWHPQERRLYWVDIPGRCLRRADPATGAVDSWPVPQEPGCIAPARSGGLVVALRDGVYRARTWGGALEQVHRFGHDVATTRFNDGKADPLGRFWAGTLYEPKHAPAAALFSVDCRPDNGQGGQPRVVRQAGDVTTANGLAWSPDGGTLYWADTQAHLVRAWDWDAAANRLGAARVFHQFAPKPSGWRPGEPGYGGRPDGAAVDAQGNYWCAMYEGARLVKLSPAGELLAVLPTPVQCPTMPCFGGDDLRTLYVTSAGNRPDDERARLPRSGHVVWTRVDVPGLPVNFFID
ncbi:MAG TPA: SMP-30/gluconolactonase/LRE family protein [Ramlibacter sp.]|jgi:sugar lactone lactonase YvrE|uniref:SMP-30/gluconolactonase/LRE family protein n=1 Tax=Ramlibacter sp. TaxID=1917967 RepID=UPI002D710CD3|nr:SMP-30/gluconolactonase/LRE family protein [Ramlibacter sp.]HZY17354.1 SMP-30/gluconolactonase/LRE family protein [Ramlibacter sp.]